MKRFLLFNVAKLGIANGTIRWTATESGSTGVWEDPFVVVKR